jgi:hypothetical protein
MAAMKFAPCGVLEKAAAQLNVAFIRDLAPHYSTSIVTQTPDGQAQYVTQKIRATITAQRGYAR